MQSIFRGEQNNINLKMNECKMNITSISLAALMEKHYLTIHRMSSVSSLSQPIKLAIK